MNSSEKTGSIDLNQYNGPLLGCMLTLQPDAEYETWQIPFKFFGPFEFDGAKVADKEYQKTFWSEVDEECPQLSDANGLYVFSLRIGENYNPHYVGITKAKDFSKEVFSDHNVVKIQFYLVPKKGKLFVHLLAKPKDINTGFYRARAKSLLWTEMFVLLLCRKKNPEILNIAGHTFLEDCGIEGITYPAKGGGKSIKTFRDACGFDSFKGQKFSPKKAAPQQPAASRTPQPISQPTAVLLASTKTA
jgi:hypothetical protein